MWGLLLCLLIIESCLNTVWLKCWTESCLHIYLQAAYKKHFQLDCDFNGKHCSNILPNRNRLIPLDIEAGFYPLWKKEIGWFMSWDDVNHWALQTNKGTWTQLLSTKISSLPQALPSCTHYCLGGQIRLTILSPLLYLCISCIFFFFLPVFLPCTSVFSHVFSFCFFLLLPPLFSCSALPDFIWFDHH